MALVEDVAAHCAWVVLAALSSACHHPPSEPSEPAPLEAALDPSSSTTTTAAQPPVTAIKPVALDCSTAPACVDGGRCFEDAGVCVRCEDHSECARFGRCTNINDRCRVRDGRDCRRSDLCREHGACSEDHGMCRVTPVGCPTSLACELEGKCRFRGGACHPASDADCEQSLTCREDGRCRLLFGSCQVSCAQTNECHSQGRCTDDARDTCIASTNAACEASSGCKQSGRCTAQKGACVATSSADCKRSQGCEMQGACELKAGRCQAQRDPKACSCTPPGMYTPEGQAAYQDCLRRGGSWGSECGAPPPSMPPSRMP